MALACGFACFLTTATQAATIRLAAVAVNDVRFDEPQSKIEAFPGDRIDVEILVSGWGTRIDRVQIAQVTVDNEALISKPGTSRCGAIRPLNAGYDVPDELLREGAFFCIPPGCGYCSEESASAGTRCHLEVADCSLGRCMGGVGNGYACETPSDCPGGTCETRVCTDELCNGGWHAGEPCVEVENQCDVGTCESRDDFLFRLAGAGQVFLGVDTGTLFPDYRFGGTIFLGDGREDPSHCVGGQHDAEPCEGDADCAEGVCDLVEFYFGTVILEVGKGAAGTFVYEPLLPPDSFVTGPGLTEATIHVEPLVIEADPGIVCDNWDGACCFAFGSCEEVPPSDCYSHGGVFAGIGSLCDDSPDFCQCPHIVDAYPRNCDNDARWPHRPEDRPNDINARLGLEWVDVTLSPNTEMSLVDADSFVLRYPPEAYAFVVRTELLGGSRVRVYFDRPLPQQRWFCLLVSCRCCGSDYFEYCWGFLPGDVDNSGVSNASDVLELIDYLYGEVPLESYQCDIDHSGVCNVTDILAEIDLLNGAGNFQVYNGVSLPGPCPTEP